jgi:hypothetical protein
MWYVSWKPVIMFLMSGICAALSVVLLYADISFCFGAKNNIIYNLVTEPELNEASSYFEANVVCLVPLIYIIATTNYGLFKLRLSNIYKLHGNHHSDPQSLLFSSCFI